MICRTIRPLQYGERALVVNARYQWNDISALNDDAPSSGWRGSFSYVDQFLDDTLGVAFGISYLDSPSQSERFEAWGYPDGPEGAAVIGGFQTIPHKAIISSALGAHGNTGVHT